MIAGSSNFTAAGLSTNLELNLGRYDPGVVGQVERWFEDLWSEAVPYDLASLYQARFAAYPPYLIYLRVLWERYGKELSAEATPAGVIHLIAEATCRTDSLSGIAQPVIENDDRTTSVGTPARGQPSASTTAWHCSSQFLVFSGEEVADLANG